MPLISIRRYLDQFSPEREAASGTSLHAGACAVIVNEVDTHLMTENGYAVLRPQWGSLTAMLDVLEVPDDLARFHAQVSVVLAERQRLEAERQLEQGRDVRHMLGALNEALLSLSSGNEDSVDRLRRVETALHRTSQLNDLVAMKTSLTETMRLVREAAEQTKTEGAGTLQKLDAELQKARTAGQRLPGLPGRAEAIRRLDAASLPGAPASLAIACQLERLRIIRSRYGAPIADDLLAAFALVSTPREGDQAYLWAEDAVVIVQTTQETVQERRDQLEETFARPFEHRVMTGGRAALLSVSVRWLCTSHAEAGPTGVTDEFDQFFEGRRWRP
ncbi:MAG: hypothetical protein IPP47_14525 [Bryobacterales bacterium]|nr:hypothetical protein [Bryobacterales bacterium]